MKRLPLLLLSLTSCASLHLGAAAPTNRTYRLSEADVARSQADDCRQEWVSGNPTVDIISAKRILEDLNVEIREGNPGGVQAAFPGLLWVKTGFWKESENFQAAILSHELVHYCDLERLKDNYELSWLTSNGRFVMETRAYAQLYRTYALQGMHKKKLRVLIDNRVESEESMRNKYRLWDIEPAQYESLTRPLWLKAAGIE